MTTEREAAGPEGVRGSAHREFQIAASRSLWQRRATVTEDVEATFRLPPGPAGDLLGWTAADLQCAPYLEFVHPDDRDLLADAARRVRTTWAPRAFVPLVMRVLARDRHYWWTRWSVTLTEDGSQVRAAGVDYLSPHPTKGPPVGTWLWDVDADTVSWSTEMLDMFGFRVGPPVGYRDFLDAVLEDDREHIDRAIRHTLDHGGTYVVDFSIAGPRGRDHWFHAAGRLVERPPAGRPQLGGLLKHLNPVRRDGPQRSPTGCG